MRLSRLLLLMVLCSVALSSIVLTATPRAETITPSNAQEVVIRFQTTTQFTETTEFCDPTNFVLVSIEEHLEIVRFALDRPAYHPGELVQYSGRVEVWEDMMFVNCYWQTQTTKQSVSPRQVSVKVGILGSSFAHTPSTSGEFGGSYTIPQTQPAGDYAATATATYRGISKQSSTSFTVLAYNPTLAIQYPSDHTGDEEVVYPGETLIVAGSGWIPNNRLTVSVGVERSNSASASASPSAPMLPLLTYNTTTDSQGNFQLGIPIPEDDTFQEGTHKVAVSQINLGAEDTFQVRYLTLEIHLDEVSSIEQGQTFIISGNVTASENGRAITGALVNLTVFGEGILIHTDENGLFRTDPISADKKPGVSEISAIASRAGYRTSPTVHQDVRVAAAMNIPAVSVAIGAGSAAGVGVSLARQGRFGRGKFATSGAEESPMIGSGQPEVRPSISGGSEHVQPLMRPGQTAQISPGQLAPVPSEQGPQAGPFILPRSSEFCIHCGLEINRDSRYCSECGLRLR